MTRSGPSPVGAASGLSANIDAVLAAEQAAESAAASLGGPADLACVFVSGEHAGKMKDVASVVRRTLAPGVLVGASAAGVMGAAEDVEDAPGVAVFAAAMPGASVRPFRYADLPHVAGAADAPEDLRDFAGALGVRADLRAIIFLADPFSVPVASVVGGVNGLPGVVEGLRYAPIIGGMASGGGAPGGNVLLLNDRVDRAGGVGVVVGGDVNVDAFVSQGCRPVGIPLLVTDAKRNIIRRLGGRPAVQVLRETVASLGQNDRELLKRGLFIGRVINEYQDRFGRGDFLVRGVIGVDHASGAVAVADRVRVGQTVQFHLRDVRAAREDLEMLLSAQQLQGPALGALVFSCQERGRKLFGRPGHDAELIASALTPPGGALAMAGLFGAAEIGPIGDKSFIHSHTVSAAVFRGRRGG